MAANNGASHDLFRLAQNLHRPGATQEDFNALTAHFEQVKQSPDAIKVAEVGFELTSESNPAEVQLIGYQLLEHVVLERWNQLSNEQHGTLVSLAWDRLISSPDNAEQWVISNKKASLLSVTIKHSNAELWDQLLPQLLQLATQSPIHAVKACLVLRNIAEEVSSSELRHTRPQLNEWRKEMLPKLLTGLDIVLPFLHACMEKNFIAATQSGNSNDCSLASQAVHSALGAIGEYADWVPVATLAKAKLIQACSWLCTTANFRTASVAVLTKISDRKRAHESENDYKEVIREVGQGLAMSAHSILTAQDRSELDGDAPVEGTAAYVVCVAMGQFGYRHLPTLLPEPAIHFLDLHLEFVKCQNLKLTHAAICLWVSLLASTERNRQALTQEFSVPDSYTTTIMRIAGDRLNLMETPAKDAEIPPLFESYEDYFRFIMEARHVLTNVIGHCASILPDQALQEAAQLLWELKKWADSGFANMEGGKGRVFAACSFIETVISFISNTYLPGGKRLRQSPNPSAVNDILESLQGMFLEMLKIPIREAWFISPMAPLIESMKRLIIFRRDNARLVIEKVFNVLVNDLPVEGGPAQLPDNPTPQWSTQLRARYRTVSILPRIAQFAPESMAQHVQALAAQMEEYRQKGSLSPGEHAKFCDLLITSASTQDLAYQQEVVSYVLRGIQQSWTSEAWRQSLSSMESMVACFCPVQETVSGISVGGGLQRWTGHHQLVVLDMALVRLRGSTSMLGENALSPSSPSWHIFNPHLQWILPPLFQLLHNLNKLYTPEGAALLRGASSALEMGSRERAIHLQQSFTYRQSDDMIEEEEATGAGKTVSDLRFWLRKTRDTIYMILHKLVSHVGGVFVSPLHNEFVTAMTAHLDCLQSTHLRVLIRKVMMPIVCACPQRHRDRWVLPVLSQLLPQVQSRLAAGWSAVLAGSSEQATLAALQGFNTSNRDAKPVNNEVIEEQLLRELTTEHLILLRCLLGAKEENQSAEEEKDQPLIEYIWERDPNTAICACATASSALWLPDNCVIRASAFLRAIIAKKGRQPLEQGTGTKMLQGALHALTTGVLLDSEVMGLIRDLLVFEPPLPGTFEVLLDLPRVNREDLEHMRKELMGSASERHQRLAIRTLLLSSGNEKLEKALREWKLPANNAKIVNATESKSKAAHPVAADEGDGLIGLALHA